MDFYTDPVEAANAAADAACGLLMIHQSPVSRQQPPRVRIDVARDIPQHKQKPRDILEYNSQVASRFAWQDIVIGQLGPEKTIAIMPGARDCTGKTVRPVECSIS